MVNWFLITLSLTGALILTLLPIPEWAIWLRPAWVLMALIYWVIVLPYRVGLGTAWLSGIATDLATGSLLGEHALALTIVIYFVTGIHLRLRLYPAIQQGFSILFFVFMYQCIIFCIQGFLGQPPASLYYWLSPVSSALIWSWFFIMLRDFHQLASLTDK